MIGVWTTLFRCLIIDFSLQWTLYVVSVIIEHERFYDVTGAFTCGLLTYLSYEWNGLWSLRHTIQTVMVCTWAFRIGLFLFIRILKQGSDKRFDGVRTDPMKMFLMWTVQGIWLFIALIPSLLLNCQYHDAPPNWRDYTGWTLWTVGFAVEVIADYQKAVFRNDPKNKGKFIQHGLWSMSRHPNYCGEIVLWFGLYLSASSELKSYQLLTVLSPILNYMLITQYSGVPILEKNGALKWGTQSNYREYLQRTPVLFPFFSKTSL